MRYYNEYEKKFYDNAACEAAEKAYLAEQEKKRNSEVAQRQNLH